MSMDQCWHTGGCALRRDFLKCPKIQFVVSRLQRPELLVHSKSPKNTKIKILVYRLLRILLFRNLEMNEKAKIPHFSAQIATYTAFS